MRELLRIGTIILFFHTSVQAQNETTLDSIFATLDDQELIIGVRIGGGMHIPAKDAQKSVDELRDANMRLPPRRVFIESFPVPIETIIRDYPKSMVVKKLFAMLEDERRDYYAHALLCEMFFPNKLCRIFFNVEDSWKTTGAHLTDKSLWKLFLIHQKYIEDCYKIKNAQF